jgi:predicted lipid carrier protein YhbT
VATSKQVESKLRQLIERLDEAGEEAQAQLARALPEPRVIQMEVPDLGTSFWSELDGGRMGPLQEGAPERADIRITANGDDLIAVIDGRKGLFSSYLAGHVKVQASMSDLMALRRLM